MKKLLIVILMLSLTIGFLLAQDSPRPGQNVGLAVETSVSVARETQSPPPGSFWFGHNDAVSDDTDGETRSGWFSHNTSDTAGSAYGFAGFYETGHRYLPSHLEAMGVQGMLLTQLTVYLGDVPPNLGVRVYTGGTGGNHLGVMEVNQTVPNPAIGWNVIELDTPVSIPADGELWFTYYAQYSTQIFAHSICTGPGVPGYGNLRRLADSGLITPNDAIATNFMIRGFAVPGGPAGTLTGTVTSGGNPIPDALVSIVGTTLTAVTNAQGQYTRTHIPTGTYSVTAAKFGFNTATNNGVVITDGGTTTSNFTLTAATQVQVSGTVIGSDSNAGVPGATVMLSGPATYGPVTTNASGAFTITGVTASATYTITINAQNYLQYTDTNVVVGTQNLSMGNILIYEFARIPRDVVATQQSTDAVVITWDKPFIPPPGSQWIRHGESDTITGALGSSTGAAAYTSVHRFDQSQLMSLGVNGGVLTEIAFWMHNGPFGAGAASSVIIKVYTGGSGSPFAPGTEVHSQVVPVASVNWNDWTEVTLSAPVSIPSSGELWFGYDLDTTGNVAGLSSASPTVNNFGNVVLWGGTWQALPADFGNFLIKAQATSATGDPIMLNPISYSIENQLGTSYYADFSGIDKNAPEPPVMSQGIYSFPRDLNLGRDASASMGSRAHTGYNVYRALESEIDNPALWVTLQTNIPHYDSQESYSYTDNTWGSAIEMTRYRWIVRSVYTNNNLSNPVISNGIMKMPEGLVYIGDPASTSFPNNPVFNFYWRNSLAQTIYKEADIPFAGMITDLMYEFRSAGDITAPRPISIYMAVIDAGQDFFPGSTWLPNDIFTLVYEGDIAVNLPAGEHYMPITLDTPFEYTGGNLVIYTWRKFDTIQYWSSVNGWKNSPAGGVASLVANIDTVDAYGTGEFPNQPAANTSTTMANVYLVFNTEGLGTLQGTVTSGGNPVADVEISLMDTSRVVYSNAQGQYLMQYITPGEYHIQAFKVGYQPYTAWEVYIGAEQTVTQNIILSASQSVNVTGRVLASDTDMPLPGATVLLTGYDTIGPVTTNAQGIFTFNNVWAGQSYVVNVSASGYYPGEFPIEVGFTNYDVGDVYAFEAAYEPTFVTAVELDDSQVLVEWQPPDPPDPTAFPFTHVDENLITNYVWGMNGSPFEMEAFHRFTPAQLSALGVAGKSLTKISFHTWQFFDPAFNYSTIEYSLRVYTGGTGSPLAPGTLVHSQSIPNSQVLLSEWNTFTLSTPVTIPTDQEIWIGWMVVQPHSLGAWVMGSVAQQNTGFGDVFRRDNLPWDTLTNDGYVETFQIIATANLQGREVSFSNMDIVEDAAHQYVLPVHLEKRDINLQNIAFGVNTEPRNIRISRNRDGGFTSNRAPRALTGYNVYRAKNSDLDNPSMWTTLAVGLSASASSFADGTWAGADAWESYRWIVRAVYTNNNLSIPVHSNPVQKMPAAYVLIGNPDSTNWQNYIPINNYYQRSMTSTIYLGEEIDMGGYITHLVWNFRAAVYPNQGLVNPVQIYMRHTEQESFPTTTSWIPYDPNDPEWFMVYNAPLPYHTSGTAYVPVLLDEPFLYNGGNIVVTVVKNASSYDGSTNVFQQTEVSGPTRSIHVRRDTGADYDPTNPETATGVLAHNPNIILSFSTAGTGHLTGTVTSGGSPVEGVQITLNGSARSVYTNAQGVYNMMYIPMGTVGITASKTGYQNYVNNNINIYEDETTTLSFSIEPLSTINVTGRVLRSDTNQPYSGASVLLTGYAEIGPVTTNAQGQFTLTGVFASQSYTIVASAPGYVTSYTDITVGTTNYNAGDIYVLEFAAPPRAVTAEEQNYNNVNITWLPPAEGGGSWFTHVTGDSYADAIGASGGGAVTFTPAMRFEQSHLQNFGVSGKQLQTIAFWPNNTGSVLGNATFTLKVWTGGSGSPLAPGTEVHSQPIPAADIVWNAWNEITLTNSVTIPTSGELWIGYEAAVSAGYVASVCDGNVMTGLADVVQWGGNWTTLTAFGFEEYEGWLLKGEAAGSRGERIVIGSHPYSIQEYLGHGITYETIASRSKDDSQIISMQSLTQTGFEIPQIVRAINMDRNTNRGARAHTGYNVYRANVNDINNPSAWVTLQTNIPHVQGQQSYSYTDTTWGNAPEMHIYRWIVRSVYTNNNLSAPVPSNPIRKMPDGVVYWGNPNSTAVSTNSPFDYYYQKSLAQTIYLGADLQIGGVLTDIIWELSSTGTVAPTTQHKVWVAEVEKDSFLTADDWIPFSEFTEVWSGTLPLNVAGQIEIHISLQEEFVYGGGNLVIMTQRFNSGWVSNNNWRHTSSGGNRSLWIRRDGDPEFDPTNPGTGNLSTTNANVTLFFNTVGYGDLTGTVTTGTPAVPLEGTEIVMTGTNRKAISNAAGVYTLKYAPMGNQHFTASRHGYVTQTFTANIPNQSAATHNITMVQQPTVPVTAVVIGSDTLTGLANANVTLRGYEDYETTTNAQGAFTFPNVYTGYTYSLRITIEKYATYIDDLIEVGTTPLDLGTITVIELTPAPRNVEAVVIGDDVRITWDAPGIITPEKWISHTVSDPFANHIGTNGANTFVKAHRFTAQQLQELGVAGQPLTMVEFVPRYLDSISSTTVHLYTGGSGSPYNAGTLAYTEPVTVPLGPEPSWTSVPLSTPFIIPTSGEFWIGIQYVVTASVPMGADAGPALIGFGNLMYYNSQWQPLTDLGDLPYNWSLRGRVGGAKGETITMSQTMANIINDSENVARDSRTANIFTNVDTSGALERSFYSRDIMMPFNSNTRGFDTPGGGSRVHESYTLWRANSVHIDDETQWIQLTTIAVTDPPQDKLEFVDRGWINQIIGEYVYIVKAMYTNEQKSDAALSNLIDKVEGAQYFPVRNLIGTHLPNTKDVKLDWQAPEKGLPRVYRVVRPGGAVDTETVELTFTEFDLPEGTYTYNVFARYHSGNSQAQSVLVEVISEAEVTPILATALKSNYPNPFNPSTIISYDIKEEGLVQIDVYNIRGQKVRTLVNDHMTTGRYTVEWLGTDDNGRSVGSGVYFYQMKAEGFSEIKRMVLMK